MKTYINLCYYLSEFFLQWDMFQTTSVEKIKIHILVHQSSTPPPKSCRLYDKVEK